MFRKLFYTITILFTVFVAMQIFRGEQPSNPILNPEDIGKEVLLDSEVRKLLRNACYDCHSNETVYPWYSVVAPASSLVFHDVEEGREELNFSEWAGYSLDKKNHKLEEIVEVLEEGEMPLMLYTLLHSEARLSQEDKELLINWAINLMGSN